MHRYWFKCSDGWVCHLFIIKYNIKLDDMDAVSSSSIPEVSYYGGQIHTYFHSDCFRSPADRGLLLLFLPFSSFFQGSISLKKENLIARYYLYRAWETRRLTRWMTQMSRTNCRTARYNISTYGHEVANGSTFNPLRYRSPDPIRESCRSVGTIDFHRGWCSQLDRQYGTGWNNW